ncbi:MAG: SpoIIE family protein phosphatase [Victivallaceae bacterium]|jgi:sigma-B regulation protein RsbU (phosphoserine phosphatase)
MSNSKIKLKTRLHLVFILIPVCAFLIISLLGLINLKSIADFAIFSGDTLEKNAVKDSKRAMYKESKDELEILAAEQALITDMHLKRIAVETQNIASLYYDLLAKPEMSQNPLMRKIKIAATSDEFSPFSIAPEANTPQVSKDIELLSMMYNSMKFIYVCNYSAEAIGIATESGVYLEYAWYPMPRDFDPRQREWYKKAVNNPGQNVWCGPYKSASTQEDVITCSRAVIKGGVTVAVVMSDISPKTISEDLIVGSENAGDAFIVDHNGCIIARNGVSDKKSLWNSGDKAEGRYGEDLIDAMIARQKGVKRYIRDGKVYYIGFAPVPSIDWSVGVIMPEAAVLASTFATQRSIETETKNYNHYINSYIVGKRLTDSGIGLAIFIVITAVSTYISRRLRNSIKALEKGAEAIGGGQLDVKIELKTGDELQELAETFNIMAGNLKQHINNIEANLSEQQQIERELAVAAQIQQSMLPRKFPAFPYRNEFDIYASTVSAREVGGDFYDYFFIDANRLYFCIGDVSGKGIPAAMFMAKARALFRYEALSGISPDQILANAGNALEKNNLSCMFASVICAILDVKTGEIIFANAGHNPPLLYDGKTFEYISLESALVIGGMRQENTAFKLQCLNLKKGDILFMYTDGVNEAMDCSNQEYGTERLQADLDTMAGANPKEIVDYISGKVTSHADGAVQSDDITMLSLKFQG